VIRANILTLATLLSAASGHANPLIILKSDTERCKGTQITFPDISKSITPSVGQLPLPNSNIEISSNSKNVRYQASAV